MQLTFVQKGIIKSLMTRGELIANGQMLLTFMRRVLNKVMCPRKESLSYTAIDGIIILASAIPHQIWGIANSLHRYQNRPMYSTVPPAFRIPELLHEPVNPVKETKNAQNSNSRNVVDRNRKSETVDSDNMWKEKYILGTCRFNAL